MGIDVLAFATSPRRHGNSETLMDYLLAAMADEGGVEVEKIVLNDVNINPCMGCNACEKLNRCVQEDDFQWVQERIIEADIMVLASPVYCMGLCAQAKALVDRIQVFRSRKYVLHLPVVPEERLGKRLGIFVSTAGQNWDFVFDSTVPSVKCFFHVSEIRDRDISYLMINGVDEMGAVRAHPTARDEALALGHEVIKKLRTLRGEN